MPAAKQFHHELSSERERFPDQMPYAWILAKFHQLHLDVFTHNFTLNYPFRNQKVILLLPNKIIYTNELLNTLYLKFSVCWPEYLWNC